MSFKKYSNTKIVLLIFGLLLLPIAHIVAAYFVVDIANAAIKQCTMEHEGIVGTALSDNLGIFSFIGEAIEDSLRDSYTEDLQEHLTKAIEFRRWAQILMYTSQFYFFVDLLCLYFRTSNCKWLVLISRFIFTIVIGFLIYSELLLIYIISSTILDAKTYGILSLFSGGDSFGYEILCSLLSAAIFVIPLILLHIIHFICANCYFESDADYYPITEELPAANQIALSQFAQKAAIIPQNNDIPQQSVSLITTFESQESSGDAVIEKLDELFHSGILTEEEFRAEKEKLMHKVGNSDKDTKIHILRDLKSLHDAEILTIDEFNKEKHCIISSKAIPIWKQGKTKVEILIELKKLLDENVLSQEEFNCQKMEILKSKEYD